jgi:site-specific DNA-adenine methylase
MKTKRKKCQDKCQVKGCKNTPTFVYITHEEGDHQMCESCVDKYLRGNKNETNTERPRYNRFVSLWVRCYNGFSRFMFNHVYGRKDLKREPPIQD